MLAIRLVFTLFGVAFLTAAEGLAAQSTGMASFSSGQEIVTASALARGDTALDKSPDVVVDISGLEGAGSSRVAPGSSGLGSNGEVRMSANAESGRALVDPLDHPVADLTESPRQSETWSNIERLTRHPATAAGLSLGAVFFGYFLVRLMVGRGAPRRPGHLPRQVVELVGFVPLGQRQQLQLIRLGSKLVLVAVSPGGAEPLAEVTDPVEVDQILAACQTGQSALAGALGRWTGRQPARDYGRVDARRPRAVFEA